MMSDVRSIEIGKRIPDELLEILVGKTCAYCHFEYNSQEALEKHGAALGYSSDIVGEKCWSKYLEGYGDPTE